MIGQKTETLFKLERIQTSIKYGQQYECGPDPNLENHAASATKL
jgi:hypothetical protein